MDARKEGAPIIAIAGDVETSLIDTAAHEELNPYKFFDTACLYVGRVVNPEQARAVINTAILTAVIDRGPTVISMPGNVASSEAVVSKRALTRPPTAITGVWTFKRPEGPTYRSPGQLLERPGFRVRSVLEP